MNNKKNTLTTQEITRQDLLQMSELSGWLDESDILLISNRGELDAVMTRPLSLVNLLTSDTATRLLTSIINQRLAEDDVTSITERDVAILKVLTRSPNIRLAELAEKLSQQPSNLHRRLQSLVDGELVLRQENGEILYSVSSLGQSAIKRTK